MKKSVFVFLITSIICLLSISLIYALDCSNDQLIMKVSEELESFGSSWDEPGLNTDYNKVCHDEIFSKPGNTIHECVSGNNVLSLLKEGSFLDFPKKTGDIDVCYGTLKCSVKTQCALNEEKLFVLKDTGLDSFLKFEDNLEDELDNNDGINSGAVFADGKIGRAVKFDGKDDYIDLGQDIYSNQDVEKGSIEFWVNLEQGGKSQFIYSNEDWMVFWINPSKYISFAIWNPSLRMFKYIYSQEPMQENQWYHVTGTWNQGIFKLYVNGQLAGENSYSALINLDSTNREVRLGKAIYWTIGNGFPYYLSGAIDEFKIRNTALTETEVIDEYNSYLEIYDNEICYDDLICEYKDACIEGETEILSLSAETNALIASDSSLGLKVCCVGDTPIVPITGEANWANMLDEIITEADVGDDVQMLAMSSAFAGQTIRFEIWKEGELSWNPLNWFDSLIVTVTGEEAKGIWENIPEDGTYSFKAINEDDDEIESGELEVSDDVNGNSMPIAVIDEPIMDSMYRTNQEVNFKQSSSDEDDLLDITWYFGDGEDDEFSDCTSDGTTDCDTTYSYSNKGTYIVRLLAEEAGSGRDQIDEDYSRIFVCEAGINTYPIISKPGLGEIVEDAVDIDGSDSFIAECFIDEAECNSNKAPSESCYSCGGDNQADPVLEPLYCFNWPKTDVAGGIGTGSGQYDMLFDWTYFSYNTQEEEDGPTGSWINNYDTAVDFSDLFTNGKHRITLQLGYDQVA